MSYTGRLFERSFDSKLNSRLYLVILFAIMSLILVPSRSRAHGGEDHGTESTAQLPETGQASIGAQSDNFELVIKFTPIEAGKAVNLEAYLSDFETNAPIANAIIEGTVNGNDSITVDSKSEKDPGLYNIKLTFPDTGTYDLLLDITAGEIADFLMVRGIEAQLKQTTNQKSGDSFPKLPIAGAIVIVVGTAAYLVVRKRKMTKNPAGTIGIMILLLGILSSSAHSHGGEDHGDGGGAAATASGTPGYLPKGSQFLLGVRTVTAKRQTLSKQIHALGRVVAPPKSQVQVYAPQAGVLISADGVSYPNQGDHVSKGQPIAALQVIDQFTIRAPISGVVTAVHSVPGEQVDPSHELFTIYDFKNVWVEANLFEDDLVHMEPGPSARISMDAYRGESFSAKFLNFDNTVDPSTRTLKAIYEISNTNMLLRPGMVVSVEIETEKRLDAIVIPSSSVMDWEGTKVAFVHIQPEIFEMRPIKIVGYYGDLVAAEGTIEEGDRVVTTGAYELLNMPIRVIAGGYR